MLSIASIFAPRPFSCLNERKVSPARASLRRRSPSNARLWGRRWPLGFDLEKEATRPDWEIQNGNPPPVSTARFAEGQPPGGLQGSFTMSKNEPNPVLRAALLEVVENQLHENNPPEARATYERLIRGG